MEQRLKEALDNIVSIAEEYVATYDMFFDITGELVDPLPHVAMLPEQDSIRANLVEKLEQERELATYFGLFKNEHTPSQNYCLEQIIYWNTSQRSIDAAGLLLWCAYAFKEFEQ